MLIVAAGGLAGAAAWMAWAVRGRSSRMFGPSVWRGPRERRSIALTFDDGPSEGTSSILRLLDRYRIAATFFQCGANAERLPAIAREVALAGHEIGNHTYSHPRLYFRSPGFIESEIERAQEVLERVSGRAPVLFRPPLGVRWFGLGGALARHGLLNVMWTGIGSDWRLDAAAAARKLLRAASNGAILCLHDGRGLRDKPDVSTTLETLGRLAPALCDRGFEFNTVSDLLCPTN